MKNAVAQGILADQSNINYIGSQFAVNPTALTQVLEFLSQNNLSYQTILSNLSIFDQSFLDKFLAYAQNKPELFGLIQTVSSHFGYDLVRINGAAQRDLLVTLIQLASQFGIGLSTILQAYQAIQSQNWSALLNLALGLNWQQILANININQLLQNIDLSQILSIAQNLLG